MDWAVFHVEPDIAEVDTWARTPGAMAHGRGTEIGAGVRDEIRSSPRQLLAAARSTAPSAPAEGLAGAEKSDCIGGLYKHVSLSLSPE